MLIYYNLQYNLITDFGQPSKDVNWLYLQFNVVTDSGQPSKDVNWLYLQFNLVIPGGKFIPTSVVRHFLPNVKWCTI